MRFTVLFTFLIFSFGLHAQTTEGLVAFYTFNDSTANDVTGSGSNGAIVGNPEFVCGVDGAALRLNGFDDHVLLLGLVGNFFENDDITFSFFMNPQSVLGTQTIFTKKEDCSENNAFSIRYTPNTNSIIVEMSENATKRVILSSQLDFDKCWQHIAMVRQGTTVKLFINGVLRESGTTLSRIDVSNAAVLGIAEGGCVGVTDNPYGGMLDDIRVYERALDDEEVVGLYAPLAPDNIITPDTTVFLGNDVQIITSNTCAESFDWMPTNFLSDPMILEPLVSPESDETYFLSFVHDDGCIATDSIRITVIDPADLDCSQAFMPSAFTPNNDGRNDTYGISNPYAILDLVSFEIFDRWGSKVFETANPFEQWDGSFKGQPLNPGVLLYKVIFNCNGEEVVNVGSLTIIR